MTAGRKANPSAKNKTDNFDDDQISKDLAASDVVNAQGAMHASVAEAFRTMGMLQMAGGFRQISVAAEILAYSRIQEFKYFKHLPVSHPDGTVRFARNFQEFCDLSNPKRGYKAIVEDIAQMRALGYPCYEALRNADIDRKSFRALLKAPEDERAAILNNESIDLKDPHAVREAIEELRDRLESVEKKNVELVEDAKANEELLADKTKKIDALDRKLKKLPETRPWSEECASLVDEINAAAKKIAPLMGVMNERIVQLGTMMAETEPEETEGRATAVTVISAVHALVNLLAPIQQRTYEEMQAYAPVQYTGLAEPK